MGTLCCRKGHFAVKFLKTFSGRGKGSAIMVLNILSMMVHMTNLRMTCWYDISLFDVGMEYSVVCTEYDDMTLSVLSVVKNMTI